MRIIIKLTNREFDLIDKIKQQKPFEDQEKLLALLGQLIAYNSGGWRLTDLGQLAWEQNKPREKTEKPKNIAFTQAVEFWLKEFHIGWTFGAVQGKALKAILAEFRRRSTDHTDATVVATFKKMCQNLPQWYRDKDLPILHSKLNEIITQIQQGTPKISYHQQNSAERFFSDYGK